MSQILSFEGKSPRIHGKAFIAPNAYVIGDVEIGHSSNIWYGSTLRGDTNVIRIGKNVNIQDGTVIHVATHGQGSYIEDDVSIGHMALIHACTIKKQAFIGMKACVMDGAVVEESAMVAAAAVVTPGKHVPSGQLWAGTPARYVRDLTEEDYKMMSWTAQHYVELSRKHRNSLII